MGVEEAELNVVQEFALTQEIETLSLHVAAGDRILGDKADSVDGTDVQHRGWQTLLVPVLTESFQEGVRRVVVTLAGLVDDRDQRAGQPEEVERVGLERFMQIPCALDLWPGGSLPCRPGHVEDGCILDKFGMLADGPMVSRGEGSGVGEGEYIHPGPLLVGTRP